MFLAQPASLFFNNVIYIQFKVDRLQIIVVAKKYIYVSQHVTEWKLSLRPLMHEKAPRNKLSSTADEKTLNATEHKDALNH